MNIAIIFAGGSGVRMGAGVPKQFLEINGKPILIHTLQIFEEHEDIDKIYLAINEEYIRYAKRLVDDFRIDKVQAIVAGGSSAHESVYHALEKAAEENPEDSVVLIHDGVRPFVAYEVISDNIESVKENGSAITCTQCYETVILSQEGHTVDATPLRKESYTAQAPQSFYLGEILGMHKELQKTEEGYGGLVDSCGIYRKMGKKAHIVLGNRGNIKVTTPEDVYMFRALLQYKENEQAFGFGMTDRVSAKLNRYMKKNKPGKRNEE